MQVAIDTEPENGERETGIHQGLFRSTQTMEGNAMQRTTIGGALLAALLLALATTTAAAAPDDSFCNKRPDHPHCPTTTLPSTPTTLPGIEPCQFDDTGRLAVWNGANPYRCQWTIDDRSATYTFQIQPARASDPTRILAPYLAVTDIYPSGGDICFRRYESGWHNLPYPTTGDGIRWTFTLPDDGNCADDNNVEDTDGADTYALTVSAQRVRQGTVQLVWTNATN